MNFRNVLYLDDNGLGPISICEYPGNSVTFLTGVLHIESKFVWPTDFRGNKTNLFFIDLFVNLGNIISFFSWIIKKDLNCLKWREI